MWWVWAGFGVFIIFALTAFTGAPYVPTRGKDVRRVFNELYPVNTDDLVVDIGSGDGVVLREAARQGARALGYEINPFLVIIAKLLDRRYPHAETKLQNLWRAAFPAGTTVVYAFGETRDIKRMGEKIQSEATRLGHRLAFISYAFEIPGHKKIKTVGAHHLYYFYPLLDTQP